MASDPQCNEEADEFFGVGAEDAAVVSWQDIRKRVCSPCEGGVRLTPQGWFLRAFEECYEVTSPVEALLHIKAFLAEYLLQDFDYKDFCIATGAWAEGTDDEQWETYYAEHIAADLRLAAALMLRVAATIAKEFNLELEDWRDVNEACGSAVHTVPACHRLKRLLPGALNDARTLRFSLPGEELNPWDSAEGRELFEQAHDTTWDRIDALTASDQPPTCCFSGTFRVTEIAVSDLFVSIHIQVVCEGRPPSGCPPKTIAVGDPCLFEADAAVAALIEVGMLLDADFFELEGGVCFMSALYSIAPGWQA